MNHPNTMSQPRPPYDHRAPSHINMPPQYPPGAMQNGQARSPGQHPFSPQMPTSNLQTNGMNGMSRISPGVQSPYNQSYTHINQQMRPQQAGSPVNGNQINDYPSAPPHPARTGSMGPPSLPINKPTDIGSLQDPLAGTGINIEEEDRRLTTSEFYGNPVPNTSFQSPQNSFGPYSGVISGPNGKFQQVSQLSAEEIQKRKDDDANWDAARQEQHPLWKMFLYGETLSQKLKRHCVDQNIVAPQSGLYIASQGQPFQVTRVNGLDGASRVVEKGEPILKSGEGDVLRDILNAICLGAKERLTGLIDMSGRLALERRQHSAGKVPREWKPLAVASAPSPNAADVAGTPVSGTSRKRTFSEANGDAEPTAGPHPVVGVFLKSSQTQRKAEEARAAKRAKRNASEAPESEQTPGMLTPGGADTPSALLLDSEKKVTKKDRKALESKFSEAQQHKSANETARMATSGLLGGKFGPGKTKKTYSWLSGGGVPGASSAISTPTRPTATSAGTSAVAAPTVSRPAAVQPTKVLGQWDEEKDSGIQARDLLLVLETDGKGPRSLLRGYNVPDG